MDEMKIKLSTKFMRGIVAKLISKLIRDKTGHDVDVKFSEIDIETVEDNICVHLNVDATISKEEFMKLMKKLV